MTKEQLERLRVHRRRLRLLDDCIRVERARAENTVSSLGPVVSRSGVGDKVGDGAAALADLYAERRRLLSLMRRERAEIETFIGTVDDPVLRKILYARCVELRSWLGAAYAAGGGNTVESVRKRYARFVNTL